MLIVRICEPSLCGCVCVCTVCPHFPALIMSLALVSESVWHLDYQKYHQIPTTIQYGQFSQNLSSLKPREPK